MLLIIILNVVFSAFVVVTIAGSHLWAIHRSHVEEVERVRAGLATPSARRTKPARRYGPATMAVHREASAARGLR